VSILTKKHFINHFFWITKKNMKWSSPFPTCTHATFSDKQTHKNSHHKGNKRNQLHANFLAKCEPFLSDRGCPAYSPEWLFLCLLCIAYCRTKPVVTFFSNNKSNLLSLVLRLAAKSCIQNLKMVFVVYCLKYDWLNSVLVSTIK